MDVVLYDDADIVIRNRDLQVAALDDDGNPMLDRPMRPCTIQVCLVVDAANPALCTWGGEASGGGRLNFEVSQVQS